MAMKQGSALCQAVVAAECTGLEQGPMLCQKPAGRWVLPPPIIPLHSQCLPWHREMSGLFISFVFCGQLGAKHIILSGDALYLIFF